MNDRLAPKELPPPPDKNALPREYKLRERNGQPRLLAPHNREHSNRNHAPFNLASKHPVRLNPASTPRVLHEWKRRALSRPASIHLVNRARNLHKLNRRELIAHPVTQAVRTGSRFLTMALARNETGKPTLRRAAMLGLLPTAANEARIKFSGICATVCRIAMAPEPPQTPIGHVRKTPQRRLTGYGQVDRRGLLEIMARGIVCRDPRIGQGLKIGVTKITTAPTASGQKILTAHALASLEQRRAMRIDRAVTMAIVPIDRDGMIMIARTDQDATITFRAIATTPQVETLIAPTAPMELQAIMIARDVQDVAKIRRTLQATTTAPACRIGCAITGSITPTPATAIGQVIGTGALATVIGMDAQVIGTAGQEPVTAMMTIGS